MQSSPGTMPPPSSSAVVVTERPVSDLARGQYPVAAWVVVLVGAVVVVSALGYLAVRWKRGKR